MQQASCLEGGPLLWIWPLYLHVNQKSDDDDDFIHLKLFMKLKYLNRCWQFTNILLLTVQLCFCIISENSDVLEKYLQGESLKSSITTCLSAYLLWFDMPTPAVVSQMSVDGKKI